MTHFDRFFATFAVMSDATCDYLVDVMERYLALLDDIAHALHPAMGVLLVPLLAPNVITIAVLWIYGGLLMGLAWILVRFESTFATA